MWLTQVRCLAIETMLCVLSRPKTRSVPTVRLQVGRVTGTCCLVSLLVGVRRTWVYLVLVLWKRVSSTLALVILKP